ncbi:MAG: family 10 glycosylhydrolase [Bacilli bacterium]
MKKIVFSSLLIIIVVLVMINSKESKSIPTISNNNEEMRGMFFSYIEFSNHFEGKESSIIKKEIEEIIDNLSKSHFNMLLLHVRPFADAIYSSEYFPYSRLLTGDSNKTLDFDILDYFISKAHQKNISIHAWINPYRISNNPSIKEVNKLASYYRLINTECIKVVKDKGVFFNPTCKDVKELIINGVKEVINNYKVDGIIFDDYFYPSQDIDLVNYLNYQNKGGTLSLSAYRLMQVSEMVKEVYKAVKEKDKNLLFGISPEGNIQNNYDSNYADTKLWASSTSYVDYLMPQIYFGFKNETRPFIDTIDMWDNIFNEKVFMLPALAFYKIGKEDSYAKDGFREWIDNNDIIKKQVIVSRSKKNYKGFSLFRYDNFFEEDKQEESHNLKDLLEEK